MESSVNTDLLRSRVDTFVLGSLLEKDGYGYDILNYIYSKTNGHYEMKQSSIYSVLKRLEKQGFVSSYIGEESNGGKRRYYSLTDKGREYLSDEQKEWAYTRTLLDNLVSDTDFDLMNDTPPFKASDLRPMTRRARTDDTESEKSEESAKTVSESPILKTQGNITQTSTDNQENPPENSLNQEVLSAALATQEQEIMASEEIIDKAIIDKAIDAPKETKDENISLELAKKPAVVEINLPKMGSTLPSSEIEVENRPSEATQATTVKSFAEKYEQLKEIQSASSSTGLFIGREREILQQPAASARKHLSDTVFGFGGASERPTEEPLATEQDINYKAIFSDIYAEKERNQTSQVIEEDEDYRHINDLKVKLRNEGFALKSYSKTESIKSMEKVKHLYIYRALRDTSVFSFLFVVLELLVLYRFKNVFEYQLTPLIVIGSVALALTATLTVLSLLKAEKKIRMNFNFKLIFTYSVILFVGVYALNLIISLLVPSISLTVKDARLYPPSMLALALPFSVIVFNILLKSGKYFTK